MSVLIIDERVIPVIANYMAHAAIHPQLDSYSLYCCRHMDKKRIAALVNRWYALNQESFAARYDEPYEGDEPLTIHFDYLPCSPYQFLKWLKCLRYNIELDTIDRTREVLEAERTDMAFLNRIIIDCMDAVIDSLPEYRDAKYSEL